MNTVALYNANGEKSGTFELNEAILSRTLKPEVVHQVYLAQLANARLPWADTKNRGEVRGGGKKPWQQKGTGRARHGSIRSPIWKGGGVTFGPLSTRSYKQKVNKKMNVAALAMCLSDKAARERLVVVEQLPASAKTKDVVAFTDKLAKNTRSILIVSEKLNVDIRKAIRNVERLSLTTGKDVNVVDVLNCETVIITKEALQALIRRVE